MKINYLAKQQIRKYKRHGSEIIQSTTFMYAHEYIIIPKIVDCRVSTTKIIEFKSKLGFNQYDITLTKEQSVLRSIMDAFEGENMQNQYSVTGYKFDFYFHCYELAIEIDEKCHKDRNSDFEIKRQKALEKEHLCGFIRINPDEKDFNISKAKDEIFRHIKESIKKSTKKSLIDELLNKLLRLEFKSNNYIKISYSIEIMPTI